MSATSTSSGEPRTEGIAVVIPAAGSGSRMGLDYPKQFHQICGRPLLIYTVHAFISHPEIKEIIIVTPQNALEQTKVLCTGYFGTNDKLKFTTGGRRRQDSVQNGLAICTCRWAMVHDAARPLVSSTLIDRCCTALRREQAFIAAIPVADTIKKAEKHVVTDTIDRRDLYRAQTPQGAPTAPLLEAFEKFGEQDITDESMLLEMAGAKVEIVEGEEINFKITRTEDLTLARPFLELIKTFPTTSLRTTEQS